MAQEQTLTGGSWLTIQKQEPGFTVEGEFVQLQRDVKGDNPRYPPQDILVLDVDGAETKIGCFEVLKRAVRAGERKIAPGDRLRIIYKGQGISKKSGAPYHDAEVKLIKASPVVANLTAANEPDPELAAGEADLEKRLAAARARRAA